MFDSPFKARYVHHFPRNDNGLNRRVHIYTFKGKIKTKYIIECEEYAHNFFAVKYYLARDRHKNIHQKFGCLSNLNEMPRIVATCIDVMIEIYKNNPYSSFGFVGSPTYGYKKDTKNQNTRRFKIYAYMTLNKFSPINFQHYTNKNKSSYLLISRSLEQGRLMKLNDLIEKIYNQLPS